MSHSKERTEKTCLNCAASLHGRYCHVCGQENIEPRQTFWHLVSHFFSDITHFDGKFFVTLKDLILKPGFLSKEFVLGRRESYLHPIRLYVFTSAIFFILFFSVVNVKDFARSDEVSMGSIDMETLRSNTLKGARNREDSQNVETAISKLANGGRLLEPGPKLPRKGIHVTTIPYMSFTEYDSVQNALNPSLRDGWLRRKITLKLIEINGKMGKDKQGFLVEWFTLFLHQFPKILFISLPIFAVLLKLLYIRNKSVYYVDHGIFALHLYVFTFIMMLLYLVFKWIETRWGWSWIWILNTALGIFALIYFYLAMINFYRQSRIKTILKYVILAILSIVMIFSLFGGFLLFSLVEA
ncbi:MAG: DUF3667 domain-containing protein [Chitinophagales bacterium]